MKERKVFCEECRKEVSFAIEDKKLVGTIRGIKYGYKGKAAKCNECGAYVDVEDINDFNLIALYDVYRGINGIVSLDKINAIPSLYSIGKRPLSILLGWGEHTFTRYVEGDIPTRQYSEILERLYNEPEYYLKILEENKNRLTSNLAYKKSYDATIKLIKEKNNLGEKIDDVISYLLNKCEDITPLALQKCLYYIQGFFYAFFDKFIFDLDCEAWAHGPVYRDVYFKYADYHFDPISKVNNFDDSIFTTQEIAILDSVVKNIGCYSGKVLEAFTHSETPWINTRGELPSGATSNRIIDRKIIAEYFKKIKERYNMSTPRDIQMYTKDMFENL